MGTHKPTYIELYCILGRLTELNEELTKALERSAQLQVEKEKALSDLNNIRKLNKAIERYCTYIYVHVYSMYINQVYAINRR